MKTVIGLFDYSADAYAAQAELIGNGVDKGRLSVVTSPKNRDYANEKYDNKSEAGEGAGIGATAGALAGGAAGLLASLGLLAIPGIGPLLAAGPLIAVLAGAGVGAAAGGVVGGLIGLGIPAHEAEIYAEGIDRGGTLLTVDASDADADRIATVLSQHNAVDIDKRAGEWETAGWKRKYPVPNASYAVNVEARSRGVERGPDAANIGSTRHLSAKIYNPK